MDYLFIMPIWLTDSYGYVITYSQFTGRYINMSEKRALSQFRKDFGLEGVRLNRL